MVCGMSKADRVARRCGRHRSGRTYEYRLRIDSRYGEALREEAARNGVTIARLIVERCCIPNDAAHALHSGPAVAKTDAQCVRELLNLRRQLNGVANNINQMAYWANANSAFPQDAELAAAAIRSTVVPRINTILDLLLDQASDGSLPAGQVPTR